jgi:phosphoglycerate kinase
MEAELAMLATCLDHPERPFAAIVGGAKISSKIAVLEQLTARADVVIIGGGMACTFLKAQGLEVGDSLVEDDQIETARQLLQKAQGAGKQFLLPVDAVVAQEFSAEAEPKTVAIDAIEPGWRMLDIGPGTLELYGEALQRCRTVLWNGPMGVFEFPAFARGTLGLAQVVAGLDATTVVGGGETAQAVEEAGVSNSISHVSTGGGAMLEYIEGRVLPGVAALAERVEA